VTRWMISIVISWSRSFHETAPHQLSAAVFQCLVPPSTLCLLNHLTLQLLRMKVPFTLGEIGHFGLAVHDPKESAKWFESALGLHKEFDFENGVAIGNDSVTIALFKGKPSPETIDHMSFHLPNMATLRKALEHLKGVGADIEDPGDEIGPEAPGSKNIGLWFRDPDGYRWELSVLGGK
jgi:catechol 2,3-dioxygenase-like lactoylglutathione lyase family enzyme